jgi:DNA-binding response OmpR family regulator
VADDDEKFLRFVTEVLTGAGYDVRAASDPGKVNEMAELFAPEVVILDVSMPGKTGFEVAKELLANPKTASVRCMFVTAHRASTHVKEAKECGGIGYLEKPFRSSSLLWMVKSLLAKKQSPDPS